jgi:hypothetical protein
VQREIDEIRAAVSRAADEVSGREKDGSFLERTLRDALARHLPSVVGLEHALGLTTFSPSLGGVDIVCDPGARGGYVGIETKVWDVEDALFDLFKLAAGTQHGKLRTGYSVIAARPRDWGRPSVVSAMAVNSHPACSSTTWSTAALLTVEAKGWARIWKRASARPHRLPARITTLSTTPVDMPRAPGHELRIISVAALGRGDLGLDDDGRPVDALEEPDGLDDIDGLFAGVHAGIARARTSPPGALFYSALEPTEKIRALNALLAEYPNLEAEITGYITTSIAQRDARRAT